MEVLKLWSIIFYLQIFNANLIKSTLVIGPSNATFNIPVNVTIPKEEISICVSLKFEGPVHNTRLFGQDLILVSVGLPFKNPTSFI